MAAPGTAPTRPAGIASAAPPAPREGDLAASSGAKKSPLIAYAAVAAGIFHQACRSFLAVVCASYGLSAIIHVLALIVFSAIMWHSHGGRTLSMTLGLSSGQSEVRLNPQSFELSAGSEGSEEPAIEIETVPIDLPSPMAPTANPEPVELSGVANHTGEDAKQQEGSGQDTEFAMPRGSNIVREGSFAAWTIPDDPRVGQDYAIVIEVTLPEGTEDYHRGDLSGQLVGTDGYRIRIPKGIEYNGIGWERPRRLPRFEHEGNLARLVLFVRGSNQALVKDKILIHSRLLNESQRMEIIF